MTTWCERSRQDNHDEDDSWSKHISAGTQIAGYSIKSQFSKAILNVGAVIEAPAFYPYLSGYENLRQYQRLHKNASKDWLLEVASLTGIEHALDQRVGTYSMGMKQR